MEDNNKHNHLKIKVGVSGAAETGTCGIHAFDQAKELGREVIRQGGIIVTGATTGFPLWSAMGAKEERGISIGLSPAANEKEHVESYRLPIDYMDLIVYTGFGFPGRDLLFTRSCDACEAARRRAHGAPRRAGRLAGPAGRRGRDALAEQSG